ncbi:SpaA isopeptide-forming pilin-related protein [Lacticaseibacillus kribbianus]|uniref:SpaA isopeptide-forming pilin-related protein n=1 Tax=Lacticaseibacillus kribbianus TaxID=2926292 RepID=UPI001CD4FE2A
MHVTKKWLDLTNSKAGADSVTVQLYQRITDPDGTTHDSKMADNSLTLSEANDWNGWFKDLPTRDDNGSPITYYFTEDSPPEGYTPVYARGAVDESGNQEVSVTNTKFGFDIKKVTVGGTTPLAGAEYTLTDVAKHSDTSIKTSDATEASLTPMTQVSPGTYLLKETKAPKGYRLDAHYYGLRLVSKDNNLADGSDFEWEQITLLAKDVIDAEDQLAKGGTTWRPLDKPEASDISGVSGYFADSVKSNLVHFIQEDAMQPLTITKIGSDTGKPLSGAEFSWQRASDDSIGLTSNAEGELVAEVIKGSPTTSLTLQSGTLFTLTETKAPEGYKPYTEPIYLLDGKLVNNKGEPLSEDELADLPVKLTLGDDGYALTFKDDPDARPWHVKVVKLDANTNKQIDGSKFTLSPSPGDSATSVLTPTATDGSDAAELAMGAKYKLTETQAPDGYVPLNGDISIVTQTTDDPPAIYWQGGQLDDEKDASASSHQVTWHVTGDHVITITVKDPKKGILPKTGGTGPLVPLILATMTFVASAGMFLLARTQRKAGERR